MLRRTIVVVIVVVGLATIGILFVSNIRLARQELKSCFSDVQGLKAGAGVRIAGVDVGTVLSVRANPQNKNCPAEVEMALATSYELHVPKDAIAAIETAGLLGPSYVGIDISQASGPPIENFGYLKSRPTKPNPSAESLLKTLDMEIIKASEAYEKSSKANAGPPAQPLKP
jgi:phospholipid/cholesterol/gamma-HCH transport system substrate-binding protein